MEERIQYWSTQIQKGLETHNYELFMRACTMLHTLERAKRELWMARN